MRFGTIRPICVLYRNNTQVGVLRCITLQIEAALNEARESSVQVESVDDVMPEIGDQLLITHIDCQLGMFDVKSVSSRSGDNSFPITVKLVDAIDRLRMCGVSGGTVFKNQNVSQVLAQLPGYIGQETGQAVIMAQVNPADVTYAGRLDTDAANVLEMMRSVVFTSGNAFRGSINGSTALIEVGRFGEDSGFIFRDGDSLHDLEANVIGATDMSWAVDGVELYSAAFVEGGTYRMPDAAGEQQTWVLLMGNDMVTPTYITPNPPGMTIEKVNRFGVNYFRMRKNGLNYGSKRIHVPGLTVDPEENPSQAQIYAASATLATIAAVYLNLKSIPLQEVQLRVSDCVCGLVVGKTAVVQQFDRRNGGMLRNERLYITRYSISIGENFAETSVEFASRLFDPEEILSASISGSNNSNTLAPGVAFKTHAGTIVVAPADPICNGADSRSKTYSYAAEGFKSTPVITLTPPGGYTAVVTAASATSVTICVTKTVAPWPGGNINVGISATGVV